MRVDLRQEIEQIYPFEFQISNFFSPSLQVLPILPSFQFSNHIHQKSASTLLSPSSTLQFKLFFFASKNISTFFVIETQDQLKVLCEEDTLAKRGWFALLLHLRQLFIYFFKFYKQKIQTNH